MAVHYSNDWFSQNYFSVLLLSYDCILVVYNIKDSLRPMNYLFINVFASGFFSFSFGFLNVGLSFSEVYL